MVRRYRRSYRPNRDKYSVENTIYFTPTAENWTQLEDSDNTQASKQVLIPIVPSTDVQGMRKVKHFTLTFSSGEDTRVAYALVYVPAGYSPNFVSIPQEGALNVSLYEPNQYVMSSGILDFTGGPCRIRSPLSRNLNSGDSIALILGVPSGTQNGVPRMSVNVQYAITLQ